MLQARRLATGLEGRLSCARHKGPISLRRAMHFGLQGIAAALSATALIFCCSCEKHHVGEASDFQQERVESGNPDGEGAAKKENTGSPAATISPTPVEFFPENTPAP